MKKTQKVVVEKTPLILKYNGYEPHSSDNGEVVASGDQDQAITAFKNAIKDRKNRKLNIAFEYPYIHNKKNVGDKTIALVEKFFNQETIDLIKQKGHDIESIKIEGYDFSVENLVGTKRRRSLVHEVADAVKTTVNALDSLISGDNDDDIEEQPTPAIAKFSEFIAKFPKIKTVELLDCNVSKDKKRGETKTQKEISEIYAKLSRVLNLNLNLIISSISTKNGVNKDLTFDQQGSVINFKRIGVYLSSLPVPKDEFLYEGPGTVSSESKANGDQQDAIEKLKIFLAPEKLRLGKLTFKKPNLRAAIQGDDKTIEDKTSSLVEKLFSGERIPRDLEDLEISGYDFRSDENLTGLIEFVGRAKNLKRLNLSENNLSIKDINKILQAIQNSNLQIESINFSGNRFVGESNKESGEVTYKHDDLEFTPTEQNNSENKDKKNTLLTTYLDLSKSFTDRHIEISIAPKKIMEAIAKPENENELPKVKKSTDNPKKYFDESSLLRSEEQKIGVLSGQSNSEGEQRPKILTRQNALKSQIFKSFAEESVFDGEGKTEGEIMNFVNNSKNLEDLKKITVKNIIFDTNSNVAFDQFFKALKEANLAEIELIDNNLNRTQIESIVRSLRGNEIRLTINETENKSNTSIPTDLNLKLSKIQFLKISLKNNRDMGGGFNEFEWSKENEKNNDDLDRKPSAKEVEVSNPIDEKMVLDHLEKNSDDEQETKTDQEQNQQPDEILMELVKKYADQKDKDAIMEYLNGLKEKALTVDRMNEKWDSWEKSNQDISDKIVSEIEIRNPTGSQLYQTHKKDLSK